MKNKINFSIPIIFFLCLSITLCLDEIKNYKLKPNIINLIALNKQRLNIFKLEYPTTKTSIIMGRKFENKSFDINNNNIHINSFNSNICDICNYCCYYNQCLSYKICLEMKFSKLFNRISIMFVMFIISLFYFYKLYFTSELSEQTNQEKIDDKTLEYLLRKYQENLKD